MTSEAGEAVPLLAPSGTKNRRWRLAAALVASLLASCAGTWSLINSPAPSTELATVTTVCESVQNADVSPEVCRTPDSHMCNRTCLVVDSWCAHFCGDACAAGAGAICIFGHLSRLNETCAAVEATPNIPTYPFDELPDFDPVSITDRDRLVCDYHAYCEDCLPSSSCSTQVEMPQPPQTIAGYGAKILNSIPGVCNRLL